MSHMICLPSWSVGPDCYRDIYKIAGRFGKRAAVIGGKTAMEKAVGLMREALADTDLTLSEPIWYGGNATHARAARLEAMEAVLTADMIFAVGGGRAVDTCKLVAAHLNKPLFTFPTIASNCAGSTSISIVYHEDDTFQGIDYPERCPVHTFLNTKIIAEAPEELLWAGIGDALSKEFEVGLASRGEALFHTTLLGTQAAHTCTDPLIEYGARALAECRTNTPGFALEQVALGVVISAGIVSNLTISADDGQSFFYNSSLAHCVYYGATMIPASGGHHLHGEIVAFGTSVLLTYDKQFAARDRVMAFCHSVGLPITMGEVELRPEDLDVVAEKAATVIEWTKAPAPVTREAFIQAILDTDAAGKAFLAAK